MSVVGPIDVGEFHAVWSSGPGDIWAAGRELYHFQGGVWTVAAPHLGTHWDYRTIHGTGPNDVWIAASSVFGTPSRILHWDGQAFTTFVNPSSQRPVGLAATADRVWYIDAGGAVLSLQR